MATGSTADAPGDCRVKKGLAGWTDAGGLYFHLCTCTQVEGRLGVAAVVLFVVQERVCVRVCACTCIHVCVLPVQV